LILTGLGQLRKVMNWQKTGGFLSSLLEKLRASRGWHCKLYNGSSSLSSVPKVVPISWHCEVHLQRTRATDLCKNVRHCEASLVHSPCFDTHPRRFLVDVVVVVVVVVTVVVVVGTAVVVGVVVGGAEFEFSSLLSSLISLTTLNLSL